MCGDWQIGTKKSAPKWVTIIIVLTVLTLLFIVIIFMIM